MFILGGSMWIIYPCPSTLFHRHWSNHMITTVSVQLSWIIWINRAVPCQNKTQQSTNCMHDYPESKVHGPNMGPIWGRQDPGGPHVGPMNLAIWVYLYILYRLQTTDPLAPWVAMSAGAMHNATVEVWDWTSNFIPHFTRHVIIIHVITYPC